MSDGRSQLMLGWVDYYHSLGFVPVAIHHVVYYPDGSKGCSCEEFRRTRATNPDPSYVCNSPGKHTVSKWRDLPPDEIYEKTKRTFHAHPQYNLGVLTGIPNKGAGSVVVLDVDTKEGKVGERSLLELQQKLSLSDQELYGTVTARTGSGGYHLFYQLPEGGVPTSAGAVGVDLDVRGDGGLVVVPPSTHENGRLYEWTQPPGSAPFAAPPPALLKQMREAKGATGRAAGAGTTLLAPSLQEVKTWIKRISKQPKTEARGAQLEEALKGTPFPFPKGQGNAGFLMVCDDLGRRWPNADPKGLLEHFRAAIEGRQQQGGGTTFDEVLGQLDRAQEAERDRRAREPWRGRYARTAEGDIKQTGQNAILALEEHSSWKGKLGFNLRANAIYWVEQPPVDLNGRKAPITKFPAHYQDDGGRVGLWLQDNERLSLGLKTIEEAIDTAARKNGFDPVVDWVEGLPAWDGTERIEHLLQGIGGTPDTDWARVVQKRWFLSLVARILKPGCKVDTMLVLEGKQGYFKSSFFKYLFPDESWFSDSLRTPDLAESTVRQLHSGPVIFEIAEMQGFKAAEIANIKAFLSASTDQVRPLYKTHHTEPRAFIIVGTTNDSEYLHDATGGRRFWPLKVEQRINTEALAEHREQIFAEAVHHYRAGEKWWLTQSEEKLARAEQEQRYEEHPWEGPIASWLDPYNPDGSKKMPGSYAPETGVTLEMVFQQAISKSDDLTKLKPKDRREVANILKKLGYTQGRKLPGKRGERRLREWVKDDTPEM